MIIQQNDMGFEPSCARQFKVCRYGPTEVTIQDLGLLSGVNNCDTVTWKTLDCYFTCDFFDNIQYSILPQLNENEILDIHELHFSSNIEVYYYNDILKLLIENNNSSNFDFSLYNFVGKLSINKTGKIQSGRSIVEVDLSSLISGIYIFEISIDGVKVKTGKINIIR